MCYKNYREMTAVALLTVSITNTGPERYPDLGRREDHLERMENRYSKPKEDNQSDQEETDLKKAQELDRQFKIKHGHENELRDKIIGFLTLIVVGTFGIPKLWELWSWWRSENKQDKETTDSESAAQTDAPTSQNSESAESPTSSAGATQQD
jgi:hypothetical protein